MLLTDREPGPLPYIDDLSILEIINLVTVGITSYNFHNHVASDIGIDQLFVPTENLKTQTHTNQIHDWTVQNKMKLNNAKTKLMIFNETLNYQFSTRVYIEDTLLDIIEETKLLGTIITTDLSWEKNTQMLIKKAYSRMTILRKLYSFNVPNSDLILIYITYIRCLLEQSCVVWHSSLRQEDSTKLERVQKIALRIIMKDTYVSYENALECTKLETLEERRSKLCLKFALSSAKNEFTKDMFQLNTSKYQIQTRNREKFKVQQARTDRLYKSSIPYMQRLLNSQASPASWGNIIIDYLKTFIPDNILM